MTAVTTKFQKVFAIHWKPNKDLMGVAISWALVVGALYTATVIVGPEAWGGMAYFVLYAIVGALLYGVRLPLYRMTVVQHRSLSELGTTTHQLGMSILLQLVFAALQFMGPLAKTQLPPMD